MDLSQPQLPAAPTAAITPMLRTVLLCDIVESTALVERLGDMRAVALLQRHDQLLRQAMSACNGLLIDKADGVLALFERPIQALDFALRYQRGLRELGEAEGLELKARIGIHIGDVMTWANAPRDVLAGAKAFEVEGLAKPVAARLMNLALPGQILMSGMAQNLCQRAVGELGDAGARLRWLLHGRYSFKGVPAPMLVHEAGEPGLAPLRAPDSGAKAWRELPLWRRPPVVALEMVLVGVLGVALFWSTLRSPPAIAFAERDWVVMADLQNRTSEKLFDDSLDTALRVGLEQSRHVNLISDLQLDRALERMQRQGQPVDRQLAVELALREGARAVILPTVAEVGGVVRVSLEVIDPNSGVTVYSESADGHGAEDVLPALDEAIVRTRTGLGEALASVESSSRPLEQVTTANLEALKAYSLALKARYEGRATDSETLLEEAVRLDPAFAMAYLRLAFLKYIQNDAVGTRGYLDQAIAHRDRLSQRESLFLDGAEATLDSPARALQKFRTLAALYPDEYRAYYNYAYFSHFDLLSSKDALEMIGPAEAVQNPARSSAAYLAGVLELAGNRYDEAISQFQKADSLGLTGSRSEHVTAYLAQRKYAEAARVQAGLSRPDATMPDLEMHKLDMIRRLDQGQWDQALQASAELERLAAGVNPLTASSAALSTLSMRAYAPDAAFAKDLQAWAATLPDRLAAADSLSRRHLLFQVLATGWMAAATGDLPLANRMLALSEDEPLVQAYPANAEMRRVLAAEIALATGDPRRAETTLESRADAAPEAGLYFSRAVLMRAHLASGRTADAEAVAAWLARNRGRAYTEANSLGAWQAANVLESSLALHTLARLAADRGDKSLAAQRRAAFEAAWPGGTELAVVKRRDGGR